MPYLINIVLVLILTLLSGVGDSQGFIHAARIWLHGHLVLPELLLSAVGFAFGISTYWIALKFGQNLHIVSPLMQTLGWFVVTIIGVALASGDFFRWQRIDQLVSILTLSGIVWLLIRTSS